MKGLDLGPILYQECLTFVWIAIGEHGESKAAYVLDGRDYVDEEQARSAVREALEQTDLRIPVAEFWPRGISAESESELAYWMSWAEFRRAFLDVYGPVYPWRLRNTPSTKPTRQPAVTPPPVPTAVPPAPLYSERHFECWGQLVEIFPDGQGPYDPVLGRKAEGYGLNGYTGEFEADTRRALQCARGFEDDDTWPLRDEDAFIAAVETRRERLLRTSFYQRHDKPEIFAAYEQAARDGRTEQSRRATYEMWRQAQRGRAYFLVDGEPVRVDLADDGTPVTAWRLDTTTGHIVSSSRSDADAVLGGSGERITEHFWLLAVVDRRRGLDAHGAIAEAYARAAAEPGENYRRRILTRTFDLWAEKFAAEDGTGQ